MLEIIGAIVALGLLITVHETGHFLVARLFGVEIEKFSIGFGPKLISFQGKETNYRISLIPLGGYVKMKGENPDEIVQDAESSFKAKKWWQRALIAFAGPFFNLILASIILIFSFAIGQTFEDQATTIGRILSEDFSELKEGDTIVSVNQNEVESWTQVLRNIKNNSNNEIQVVRDGTALTIQFNSIDEIAFADQIDDYQVPDAIFMFGETFVVFDHYKDEIYIVAVGRGQLKKDDLEQKVLAIRTRLLDNDFRAYDIDEIVYSCKAQIDVDKEQFISAVEELRQEIIKGNLLQAVLSRRIEARTSIPPIEAYRRLRRENPSPYLFYLDFDQFVLFGSSPEVMVQLKGTTASLKPIAGTRPRGVSKQKDIDLEGELLADPKERAEHLMLIDLARNDLGRISQSGTVRTVSEYVVERYSHVMHIVSEVESEILEDKDVADLIKATFPAGTVSGAPKIKAIETLSKIEKKRRGPYAGLVGYFDKSGDFDSCIAIRSVLVKDDIYYIQSGAGIVYDSVAENEYQETVNKARAVLRSIGVESENERI